MPEHYNHGGVTVLHGDCLDELRTLPDASVHAVITDPPYSLDFMGRDWDRHETPAAFQEWCRQWAAESLRVLKPGGHLLAFGGSRTWHRLAGGIEDAGFEIRDSIAWLYGSGFPKSMDVAKAITGMQLGHGSNSSAIRKATMGEDYEASGVRGNRDGPGRRSDTGMAGLTLELTEDARRFEGWGTALKPSFEPIVVGRKPLSGTVAANVLEHGTGALNIEATRIPTSESLGGGAYAADGARAVSGSLNPSGMNAPGATAHGDFVQPSGRWPSNVLLDEDQAAALDAASGITRSTVDKDPMVVTDSSWFTGGGKAHRVQRGDEGGASRFFPVFRWQAKAPTSERPDVGGVQHPTVKPLALMQWLVRLVTPAGGTVLEPFAGSGTTLEACIREGFNVIGIEREADYLPLIMSRIRKDHAQSLFDVFEDTA